VSWQGSIPTTDTDRIAGAGAGTDARDMPTRASVTDQLAAIGGDTLAAVTRAIAMRPAAKPLHPRGRVLWATLRHVPPDRPTGVAWLETPGEERVLVRVSRAVGLPRVLPDIQGIAVRVPLEAGTADLLFASTGTGSVTRFLLTPAWRPQNRPLTTLLPYRSPGGPLLLGLRATAEDRWELLVAGAVGSWSRAGELVLDEAAVDDVLELDPVCNEVPGMPNYEWVRRLREPSYALARAHRR
jgi:hypothetical protein